MRLPQLITFGIVLIAGAIGWMDWLTIISKQPALWFDPLQWLDAFYRSIQLFLGNFDRPGGAGNNLPIELQLARFFAPMVTIWAVVELITGELLKWPGVLWSRVSRRREYLVIGLGTAGQAIARALARQPPALAGTLRRARITVLDRHLDAHKQRFANSLGLYLIGRDALLLGKRMRWVAGVARAKRIYVATGSDAENLAIAATFAEWLGPEAGRIWVHIGDYGLLDRLRDIDPAEHVAKPHRPRYFSLREAAVEKLYGEDAPVTETMSAGLECTHIAVVGTDAFSRILIEGAALYASFGPPKFSKPRATVIAPSASRFLKELKARHPALGDWIDLEARNIAPGALCWSTEDACISEYEAATARVTHWIFAEQHLPEALALYRGMTTTQRAAAKIFVASEFDASQAPVAGGVSNRQRISVDFYGSMRDAAPWSIALNSQLEELGREFHEKWREGMLALGHKADAYEKISETARISNWRAAVHAMLKLRYLNFGSLDPCEHALGLSKADVNRLRDLLDQTDIVAGLGQFEYIRWCVDRILDGWTYAEERDDVRRTRPQLKHGRGRYHELLPADVQKDRDQTHVLLAWLERKLGSRKSRPRQPGAGESQPGPS